MSSPDKCSVHSVWWWDRQLCFRCSLHCTSTASKGTKRRILIGYCRTKSCELLQTQFIATIFIVWFSLLLRMPFDYNANLGNYLLVLAIEGVAGSTCSSMLALINSFVVCISWYAVACFTDLLATFDAIEDQAHKQIKHELKKSIRFHVIILKWVKAFPYRCRECAVFDLHFSDT